MDINKNINIVLVCIDNFQEYIFINIRNLLHLKHEHIYVIINKKYKERFDEFKEKQQIHLIFVEDLKEDFNFYDKTPLDKTFRNGFWALTTLRLFYIHAFMKKYNVKNVLHLENDVLLYYNCDVLLSLFDDDKIYLPFDRYYRNIISILYIPNYNILEFLLQHYNISLIDMSSMAHLKMKFPNLIVNLPICVPLNHFNNEQKFVSLNYHHFQFIFDGVALGQYLGGIDPRNTDEQTTVGFVNETCCIHYDKFIFVWRQFENNYKRPFLKINDNDEIPIFNLHIHSKHLENFVNL